MKKKDPNYVYKEGERTFPYSKNDSWVAKTITTVILVFLGIIVVTVLHNNGIL